MRRAGPLVAVLICLPGAVGCVGGLSRPPEAPRWEPAGMTKCSVKSGQSEPLVVEWPSADRAKLEALSRQGVVAVHYVGCEMQVLARCGASGRYLYTQTGHKKDQVFIRNEDELYANLPFGAAQFEGALRQSGQLTVSMTIVGRYQSERSVHAGDLVGECGNATHVVSGLIVGAFEFASGAQSEAAVRASVFDTGGGGETRAVKHVLTADGNQAACATAESPDQPPAECRALIRVELSPIPEVQARLEEQQRQAREQELQRRDAARERRTWGWVLTGVGAAGLAAAGTFAYLGSRQNQRVADGGLGTASDIESTVEKGQTYNKLTWGFALGAAPFISVGAPLVLFNSDPNEPTQGRWSPSSTTQVAGGRP